MKVKINADELASHLKELDTKARAGYERYKKAFDELNEAYLLCLAPELENTLTRRNKSKNFIPKLNAKAKRIYDGLTETYFNNDKFAKLEPYINSSNDVIDKWQEALDHYCEMLGLYRVFAPIFLRAPFSASLVVKVFWDDKKQKAVVEDVGLDRIFFDPQAQSVDDVRYLVNDIYLTELDLAQAKKDKSLSYDDELFKGKNPYERFKITEYYEKIGPSWYVSSLYEGAVLRARVKLKDGQPFVWGWLLPQIRRNDEEDFVCAYGEPALGAILPLQHEMNVVRNSMTDIIRQQTNPRLIIDSSSMTDAAQFDTLSPVVNVERGGYMGVVPVGDLSGTQFGLGVIEQEMSETSGVSPQQNGTQTVRKETATMASIMANEGSVRLQGYIRTFNETFFEPIFERLAKLVWKYGDSMFFAGYVRQEIPSFNVNLNTGIGALNKEVQKQSLMDASAVIGAQFNMCLQTGDANGAERMKRANEKILSELLPLYGIKKPDEFLGKGAFTNENDLQPSARGYDKGALLQPPDSGAGI